MQNGVLYLQRMAQLLQMEYDNEREEYRVQSERMPLSRKVKRGICWYPVKVGSSFYNSLNQFCVEITRQHNEENDDIDSLFEYGKPVQFFTPSPALPLAGRGRGKSPSTDDSIEKKTNDSTNNNNICSQSPSPFRGRGGEGVVSFVDGDRMVVVLSDSQQYLDLQQAEHLGVQLYFDETTYRTMFHALADVIKAKGNRLAELRDICAGELKPKRRAVAPMSFPWLNRTQEEAVNEALAAKDVMVVHGPPGTGKTTTLVETIYETLRRETQVMVCAQSNMAVDWISEQLVDHGIPVLRIGNPSRVNDKMLSFTYERKFEAHPDYPELWNIRKAIRQMQANRKKGDSTHQKIARLRDRATEIEMNIRAQLFDEARVIACTLVGSANKLLVRQRFSTLFIDEAAQALEPACWIAIRRCSRVILAGDHQQLPPTIKCFDAMRQGLGKTLMERIVENQPSAVSLLKVQYRMNDDIMRFSSEWFYHGQVESHPSVHHRSVLDWEDAITWIDTTPPQPSPTGEGVIKSPSTGFFNDNSTDKPIDKSNHETPSPVGEGWGGVVFGEQFIGETHGRINRAEAELVLATLIDYINKIGKERFMQERLDIGIISPYKVQTQYLRQRIKQADELKPFRKMISVNTVDGFQGQERDIIMISLVRSNDKGEIGFLGDLRRMNVAMTRARMKLFIFGDKETLSHHRFYRQLIEYVENGLH